MLTVCLTVLQNQTHEKPVITETTGGNPTITKDPNVIYLAIDSHMQFYGCTNAISELHPCKKVQCQSCRDDWLKENNLSDADLRRKMKQALKDGDNTPRDSHNPEMRAQTEQRGTGICREIEGFIAFDQYAMHVFDPKYAKPNHPTVCLKCTNHFVLITKTIARALKVCFG